jgi:hypothetical protein
VLWTKEHRAPFVGFCVVAIVCSFMIARAVRDEGIRRFVERGVPISVLASIAHDVTIAADLGSNARNAEDPARTHAMLTLAGAGVSAPETTGPNGFGVETVGLVDRANHRSGTPRAGAHQATKHHPRAHHTRPGAGRPPDTGPPDTGPPPPPPPPPLTPAQIRHQRLVEHARVVKQHDNAMRKAAKEREHAAVVRAHDAAVRQAAVERTHANAVREAAVTREHAAVVRAHDAAMRHAAVERVHANTLRLAAIARAHAAVVRAHDAAMRHAAAVRAHNAAVKAHQAEQGSGQVVTTP